MRIVPLQPTLDDLIKEAMNNVVPASHGQRMSDHVWVQENGGRGCPRGGDGSQAIYVCQLCRMMDYGDLGGPGYHDCFSSPEGCEGCFTLEDQMDFPDVAHWNPVDQYRRANQGNRE